MKWMLMALALAGCARSTNGANDGHGRDLAVAGGNPGEGTGGNGTGADLSTSAPADLTSASQDLTLVSEDMTSVSDLAQPAVDLAQPAVDMAQRPADMAQPPADMTQTSSSADVHIMIDNFCNTSTNPTVINAPLHVALNLTFHNDSVDYDSDIWSSRGYGELGLTKGTSWVDPIQHCLNPSPYTEYFDIGIAGGPVGNSCPNYRLYIHCN